MTEWMTVLDIKDLKAIQTALEIALSDFDFHEKKFHRIGVSESNLVKSKEKIEVSLKGLSILCNKKEK